MARRGVPLLGDSSTPVDHALGLVEASAFDVQGGCVKATAERRRSDTALRQRVPQSPSMRKPCYRVRHFLVRSSLGFSDSLSLQFLRQQNRISSTCCDVLLRGCFVNVCDLLLFRSKFRTCLRGFCIDHCRRESVGAFPLELWGTSICHGRDYFLGNTSGYLAII
ncbi:hypothetical protein MUK42_28561 [Musa troglodytarum]|uniref:Uncharacterized protein n=1 Tax=Musa troglodytarum TaxID=320322 RepID=A0A9E7JMY9_9LILI|nr:hypothetical protein MUK42_28561 [Musa troglodytarum]